MMILAGTSISMVLLRRTKVSRCTTVSTGQRTMVGVGGIDGLRCRVLHHRLKTCRENSDADLVLWVELNVSNVSTFQL